MPEKRLDRTRMNYRRDDSTRRTAQDDLVCPKCTAANRPGMTAPYIELTPRGLAVCTICSAAWPTRGQ